MMLKQESRLRNGRFSVQREVSVLADLELSIVVLCFNEIVMSTAI